LQYLRVLSLFQNTNLLLSFYNDDNDNDDDDDDDDDDSADDSADDVDDV